MKHYYFIAYHFLSAQGWSHGSAEIMYVKPITDMNDLQVIGDSLLENVQKQVPSASNLVIMNYQVLRIERE